MEITFRHSLEEKAPFSLSKEHGISLGLAKPRLHLFPFQGKAGKDKYALYAEEMIWHGENPPELTWFEKRYFILQKNPKVENVYYKINKESFQKRLNVSSSELGACANSGYIPLMQQKLEQAIREDKALWGIYKDQINISKLKFLCNGPLKCHTSILDTHFMVGDCILKNAQEKDLIKLMEFVENIKTNYKELARGASSWIEFAKKQIPFPYPRPDPDAKCKEFIEKLEKLKKQSVQNYNSLSKMESLKDWEKVKEENRAYNASVDESLNAAEELIRMLKVESPENEE